MTGPAPVTADRRRRYEEARDARPGTYPPREPGISESRVRYTEWKAARQELANPAPAAPGLPARSRACAWYCYSAPLYSCRYHPPRIRSS